MGGKRKHRQTWRVTIYRTDSHTPVVYDNVKHAWWEGSNYIIAQYAAGDDGRHHYWTWPRNGVSHVLEERQ